MGRIFDRIPQEPAVCVKEKRLSQAETQRSDDERLAAVSSESSLSSGAVSLPAPLDFVQLKSEEAMDCNAACLQYMVDVADAGLRLTNAGLTTMRSSSQHTKKSIAIQVEKDSVAGVDIPGLECVRHTAEFDLDAKTVFDTYARLNYTEAIDEYTYLVEMLEDIDTSPNKRFSWCHVVYTADKFAPGCAHRDFVTLDFVDKDNLLLVSRSCLHPLRVVTKKPKSSHCLRGWFTKNPSRTFRSPLCYFLRVIPLGERRCRVVQFQYSDIGGMFLPSMQTAAVVDFGLKSIARFYRLVKKVQENGLNVGPGTADYLTNPLLPKWRKPVSEVIPGL